MTPTLRRMIAIPRFLAMDSFSWNMIQLKTVVNTVERQKIVEITPKFSLACLE